MGIFSGLFKSRDKPENYVQGSTYSFFFGNTTSGKTVNEYTAMQTTAVYSCVRVLSEALASLPLNYFVVYPAYVAVLHFPEEAIISAYEAILGKIAHFPTANPLLNCLLIFNVTFTFAKGLLNVLISALIYKPLSPLLHK